MRVFLSAVLVSLLSSAVSAEDRNSEHALKTLEIYTNIIEMETSKNLGNVPGMARYLADEMIAGGIRGIWNFTPTKLIVPSDVILQREDLASSLAVLSHRLLVGTTPERKRL